MSLLNILQFPDPRLKHAALAVETFDAALQEIVASMLETMYEAQGVGLAAIQVNIPKRIIVIDVSEARNEPLALINPQIVNKQGTLEWEEGCLSFPGVYAKVKRAAEIGISYYDCAGKKETLDATGLLSVCIQHELDHLDGITFYDHLSPLKQTIIKKKLEKIRRKTL
jgi:peptide deformylase